MHFMLLYSYDMDEFGNLDFTESPSQFANEKKFNTKNSNTNTKIKAYRPDITRRRKKPRKDPIRTTLDHFSYFGSSLNDGNVDNNEVVYGLDYPKQSVSYNYRKPVSNRPSQYGQTKNDGLDYPKQSVSYNYRKPVSNRPSQYGQTKNNQATTEQSVSYNYRKPMSNRPSLDTRYFEKYGQTKNVQSNTGNIWTFQ